MKIVKEGLIVEPLEDIIVEPLVYNTSQDFSSVKNVLLIDKNVYESDLFQTSSNENTFTIIYSQNSSSDDILNLLQNNIQTIDHLGLIFHNSENELKPFLNNYYLFDNNDISGSTPYSKNMEFIIGLIQKFSIKNIDFLACNTLNYDIWKNYYAVLMDKTGVIVGASNNTTGNIQYGGDWILESDNTNVISIYFNNSILNYTGSLNNNVSGNVSLDQVYFDNPSNWPLYVSANSTIIIVENIIVTNTNNCIVIIGENVVIDGLNHSVTFNDITNYVGFINNGTFNIAGFSHLTVQNITINATNSTLINASGNRPTWLCANSGFGTSAINILIQNCYNTALISKDFIGGICGSGAGYNNGSVTITNCYNTGSISGNASGGICGSETGWNNGSVTITNCYNTGSISGDNSGGICGLGAGYNNGSVTITNCYNTGSISGTYSGGICGSGAGYNNVSLTITNCYNTASVSGTYSGGICGAYAGTVGDNTYYSIVNINNCYNAGTFGTNQGIGLICGQATAFCNSSLPGNNIVNITNCYNLSVVNNSTQGAIFVEEDPSDGNPSGSINVGTVNITHCYILYGNAIGVFLNNVPGTINQSNITTSSNGLWNDSEANTCLTGSGSLWFSPYLNTPYLLSSYNLEIYTPNVVTSSTNNYTSTPGLFNHSYKIISVNNNSPGNNISIDTNTGTITLIHSDYNMNQYLINVLSYQLDASNNYYGYELNNLNVTFNSQIACFKKDTKILTNIGYKYVQNLRKGDFIKTSRDGYKKIDMIGKQEIYHPASEKRVKHQLYKCSTSKYPEVFEDLVITGCHCILVDKFSSEEEKTKTFNVSNDIYVTDKKYRLPACVDERASVYKPAGNYTIYHFALENDDYYMNYGVYANGLLVETCSKRYLKELSNMNLIE